ncbi:hypothetical protein ACNVK0_000019 [Enterobacter hormaechei]
MAGLTKEQRAQREAEKLAAQQEQQEQQEQQGIDLVLMVRDTPEFSGGPLRADVHPDEVNNWLALDWRLEE